MYRIAYIIVTYNGLNHISKCVKGIRKFDKTGYILILDNASTDYTIEMSKKLPGDKIISLQSNYGFGKANNIGLKYVYNKGFDLFFLVNQDLYFDKGDFEVFLQIAKNKLSEGYAVISPLHMAQNGVDFDFKFKVYLSPQNTPNFLEDYKAGELKVLYPTKVVNAAAWVLSRKTLNTVGFFDPIFDHYGEDTDYINRVRYHKLKLGICTKLLAVHNRPQGEEVNKAKLVNRTKVWTLAFLKDINFPLTKQYIRFPLIMRQRINQQATLGGFLFYYLKVMLFALQKLNKIISSRNTSKKKMAFYNLVPDHE